jgi:long-chain acyl-CoA synthetase
MFLRSVDAHPDKVALLMEKDGLRQVLTYRDLQERVDRLARGLRKLGFKPGEHIALIGENCPEWEIVYLSIQWAGCTVVPLDRLLKVQELRHIIRDSDSAAVMATGTYTDTIDEALTEMNRVIRKFTTGQAPQGWIGIEELIARGSDHLPIELPAELEGTAAILYTSGTTGQAKGVMLSHRNIACNVVGAYQAIYFGDSDTFVSILPLHHSFEATAGFLTPLCAGATIVFAPSLKSKEILATIARHNVTVMLGVPLLFEKIVEGVQRQVRDSPSFKRFVFGVGMKIGKWAPGLAHAMFGKVRRAMGMEHVRFLVSGGAALQSWASIFMERLGLPILQGYGLTETAPIISVNRPDDADNTSVGPPIPGFEVWIHDPDENGNGEIVVRGPSVMKGYYKNPEATRAVLSEDGWFRTGDLGKIDDKGLLHVTGRAKNLIVTPAGKNVYPEEIEAVLVQNPYILEIVVYGHLNEATGREEIHAVIVPNHDLLDQEKPHIGDRDLEAFMREQVRVECEKLAEFKRIKHFELQEEELPKTTTRKVKRYLFDRKSIAV